MDQLSITFTQAALPEPPPVDSVAMIEKQRLIECADRELKRGRVDLAFGLEQLTALVKDGQLVALSHDLARSLGLA